MNKINLGVFSELSNNKADRDLRNVDLTKTDIIIEYQEPTVENGYTWYRLYASGWIEQGGRTDIEATNTTINLCCAMESTSYTLVLTASDNGDVHNVSTTYSTKTTTSFTCSITVNGERFPGYVNWQISGKADMTGHEVLPSKKAIDEYDHMVIVFQKPTAANNYTWYRKYADGWVEQGGIGKGNSSITLPIEMADTTYVLLGTISQNDDASLSIVMQSKTTTSFWCRTTYSGQAFDYSFAWQVSGMYATEE